MNFFTVLKELRPLHAISSETIENRKRNPCHPERNTEKKTQACHSERNTEKTLAMSS